MFEQEPPPAGHSLFALPNVIMAPHVAGVTREAVDRMSEQTARNILSALDGEPIRQNVINRTCSAERSIDRSGAPIMDRGAASVFSGCADGFQGIRQT